MGAQGQEQGVAVGRGLGDCGRGDHSGAAWPVLDHEGLAEALGHLRLQHARD
jgi:hypothetical protein